MTNDAKKVNGEAKHAPLRNVVKFLELIITVAERPKHLPGWAVFYGVSGRGKTTAAVQGTMKTRAVYIECGASWSASTLTDSIRHELTGDTSSGIPPEQG